MVSLSGPDDIEVEQIVYNSKKAKKGALFVCIKGATSNGHDFAKEAVEKGAVVVVCSEPLSFKIETTQIRVRDCRRALAIMAAAFFQHPAEKLFVIGITGTKGKTTTAYMIQSILNCGGIKTGLIGTVEVDTGGRYLESSQTTPESLELQQYLREMIDNGCRAVVMEVSSQALKHDRVYGVTFDVGILTNIEEDHIAPREHPDFADYMACKSKLFKQCDTAIVNKDGAFLEKIMEGHMCRQVLTYGLTSSADLYAQSMDFVRIKGKFAVEFQAKGRYNINLVVSSAGRFSVYNALAAVLAAKACAANDDAVAAGLKQYHAPGRQEVFLLGYDKVVMVDYAHNGMALQGLLEALRSYHPAKVTCVFGCGGERDRNRRFNMGEVAAMYADYSIITSDNPRNESPSSIISDIIVKIEDCDGKYCIVEDRRLAIETAIRQCQPGEIIVIAGKGHENYQIIGNKKIHFDDREVVRSLIEKVNHEQNNNRRNQIGYRGSATVWNLD